MIRLNTEVYINKIKDYFSDRENVKKTIMVALSALMFLGLCISYAINTYWFIPVGFFFLMFVPLFPLGTAVNDFRDRIAFIA